MSHTNEPLKFDTVRFITKSNYISYINDELFKHDIDIITGELKSLEYNHHGHTDITPFELYIRANFRSNRMTIEFSSKILLAEYPLLITNQTFRQCLLNIESLGICKLDIDRIIKDCYFNKLHVTKDIELELTAEILNSLNQCTGDYRRYKWYRYTDAILFTKDVKAVDCRESIIIYNKETEIALSKNKLFLNKTGNTEQILLHFKGKTRFEVNLENKRRIMKDLGIADTSFHSVMNTHKNILLSLFDKIFATDTLSQSNAIQIDNIVDYGIWCIIRYHNFELKSIEQEIKDIALYSNKTKGAMGKQMKKIKTMIQASLNQNHNTDFILSQIREKLKD